MKLAISSRTTSHVRGSRRPRSCRDFHSTESKHTIAISCYSSYPSDNSRRIWRGRSRLQCITHARRSFEQSSILGELPNKMQQRQDLIVDLMLRDMHLEDARRHGVTKQLQPGSACLNMAHNMQDEGNGFYYYESVTVWSSSNGYSKQGPPGASLALIAAGTISAMYAVVGTAFWKQFPATRFHATAKWRLTLLWPLLYIFSPKFRIELRNAVTGVHKPGCGSDNMHHNTEASA